MDPKKIIRFEINMGQAEEQGLWPTSDPGTWPATQYKGRMCSIEGYAVEIYLHQFRDAQSEIRAKIQCKVYDAKDESYHMLDIRVLENMTSYIDACLESRMYCYNHYKAAQK